MIKEKQLIKYCQDHLLNADVEDGILEIDDKYYSIADSEENVFDEDMEVELKMNEQCIGWVFEFCGRWYIQDYEEEFVQFKELKYIGNAVMSIPTESFLGIRSGYELMNAMGIYSDWIKKAKFLGVKSLGVCERNTLSGVLDFQSQCLGEDIKPIFGITVPVIGDREEFDMKFYAKDFQGWQNLLKYNTKINVEGVNAIPLSYIDKNREGVFSIGDPKSMLFEDTPEFMDYYQLDTPTYLNIDVDAEFMDNFEKFITSDLKPISISDAFYIEKNEWEVREALWKVGKAFDVKTNNQHFKCKDEQAAELIGMFTSDSNGWLKLFQQSVENEKFVVGNCNFIYDTDTRHLPRYIMTESEAREFDTNEDLFFHLVEKGFKEKN